MIDQSTKPHISPNKTYGWIEARIKQIREDKEIGGKKIFWGLEKRRKVISERMVNNIVKRDNPARVYRHKREYIYRKKKISVPGQIVEVDIKYGVYFGFSR